MRRVIHELRSWSSWIIVLLILGYKLYSHSSWWVMAWVIVVILAMVVMAMCPLKIFKPIRWLMWPGIKRQFTRKIKNVGSDLLTFPMLLWLEVAGEKIYLDHGTLRLEAAALKHVDEIGKKMDETIKEFAKLKMDSLKEEENEKSPS